AVEVAHFLRDHGLGGGADAPSPEFDGRPGFVADETNGFPMTIIPGGPSDAPLIGAGNLDFGGVHDGIEETEGGAENPDDGGQQIESAPSIPPTAGPAENVFAGFALLGESAGDVEHAVEPEPGEPGRSVGQHRDRQVPFRDDGGA